MRRIVTAIMSTISGLVLLFGYHTSTSTAMGSATPVVQQPPPSGPAVSPRSSTTGGAQGSRPSATPRRSSTSRASRPASAATYTGAVASTQWGPVQVRITVLGGKVTRAQAVQYPQGNSNDAQINGNALPILDQEVVQKQSASIDAVSGATVTSGGYLQSLQSAIDQAHL